MEYVLYNRMCSLAFTGLSACVQLNADNGLCVCVCALACANALHEFGSCSAAPSSRNKNSSAASPNKNTRAAAPGRVEAWLGHGVPQGAGMGGTGIQSMATEEGMGIEEAKGIEGFASGMSQGRGSIQEWFLEETEKLRLDVSLREECGDQGVGGGGGTGDGDASTSFDGKSFDGVGLEEGGGTDSVTDGLCSPNGNDTLLIKSPESFIRNTLLLRAEARCCVRACACVRSFLSYAAPARTHTRSMV